MRRRWLLGLGLALAVLAIADQVLLRVALSDGVFLGRRIAPYDPPIFHAPQQRRLELIAAHLERGEPPATHFNHDAEIGWCPPRDGAVGDDHFDWAGARIGVAPLARERPAGVRRIVAVGCSFTYGAEVADAETWPARLDAAREDLELANLAFGAYGVDQALLRYLRDGRPLAPDEVCLGFFPTSALRVTTVYRLAQRHWGQTVLFKPRFLLDERGGLVFVANPADSMQRTYELLTDQPQFFAATRDSDRWVRRFPAAYAPEGSRWIHHSGFGRIALSALEVRGRDALAALADPRHEAHRLTTALVLRLQEAARSDGARFRMLILPGEPGLREHREGERASWSALVARLQAEGVEVWDLTAWLDERDRAQPGRIWAPGGHYSAIGNGWVAEFLAQHVD